MNNWAHNVTEVKEFDKWTRSLHQSDKPLKPVNSIKETYSNMHISVCSYMFVFFLFYSKASSRAYYIKLASKTSLIYCKMVPRNSEEEPCTWGGWTLAMKLDGRLVFLDFVLSRTEYFNHDFALCACVAVMSLYVILQAPRQV